MVPKAIRHWTSGLAGARRDLSNSNETPLETSRKKRVHNGKNDDQAVIPALPSAVESARPRPSESTTGQERINQYEPITQEANDELLAACVAARNVTAFGMIYDRHAQPVFAMAAHMLGVSEAEEVTQEVFMRLWHKAHQYDPKRGPFVHWFMSIARNHILDKLRARSERQRLVAAEEIDQLLSEAADPNVDVLEQVWLQQRGDAILQALRTIPPEQRRVIVLAYFGDLSQSAIADHLGLPLGTVKKRIRLGLQKLRTALTDESSRISIRMDHYE